MGEHAKVTAAHDNDALGYLSARFPDVANAPSATRTATASEGVHVLWRAGVVTADMLADAVADFHALPRATMDAVSECTPAIGELSRRYLRESYIFPFTRDGALALAVADPGQEATLRAVRLALPAATSLHVLSFEEIDQLFERSSSSATALPATVFAEAADDPAMESADSLQDLARGAPVVRVIDSILERAVELSATDIHFETERDHLRVRLRVDGFLRLDQNLPLSMAAAVISRLKILAGLDIADRRLPQDGRAAIRVGRTEVDLRVAIMPTTHGETAVLRILTRDTRLLDFTRIGMDARNQQAVRALLAEPNGIVIVTGPTGSGKTTTLAAAISILNDPARKIVTIEDPVEYQIAGVHQTQLKTSIGLTFASALRSFLRHDPDVIMVGEMRDQETAGVGIQAALTGHLVLTTLHTNSACDAIVRLTDMGIEPYLISASLRGVVGQRLVRKLCERCKVPDERASREAESMAAERGIEAVAGSVCHAPRGCDACGQTGYRGRLGIFEVMHMTDRMRARMRDDCSADALVVVARSDGMVSMFADGLNKCAAGLTSIDEVLRATG